MQLSSNLKGNSRATKALLLDHLSGEYDWGKRKKTKALLGLLFFKSQQIIKFEMEFFLSGFLFKLGYDLSV